VLAAFYVVGNAFAKFDGAVIAPDFCGLARQAGEVIP